jgi:hypothetical protein
MARKPADPVFCDAESKRKRDAKEKKRKNTADVRGMLDAVGLCVLCGGEEEGGEYDDELSLSYSLSSAAASEITNFPKDDATESAKINNQLEAIFRRDGGGQRSERVMKVNVTWNNGVDLGCDEDDGHDNDDAIDNHDQVHNQLEAIFRRDGGGQ